MWPAAAALVAMTLSGAPAGDRVLLCRPRVAGDPALARGDAVVEAGRARTDRLLDYGVTCESTGEAARAAKRAGLTHAILVSAEGRTDGSTFELTVVDAMDRVIEVRRLAVEPGADAAGPVGSGLDGLVAELRRPETRRLQRRTALGVAGGGVALLAAGVGLAAAARGAADRANGATTPEAYLGARQSWERSRALSGAALGLGGAALAAGLVWRFDLMGGD